MAITKTIYERLMLAAAYSSAALPSALAAQASPDYVLLSDEYGGRGYVGMTMVGALPQEPIAALTAKPISGKRIGDMFAGLCLRALFDRTSYDAARATVAPEFVSHTVALAATSTPKPLLGSYSMPVLQITQEHSVYGIASLWQGNEASSLENRLILRYSGGLVITGPVSAKRLYAPQCNLTVHVTGLTSATELLDTVNAAAVGFTPGKRTEKPKYGSATWSKVGAGSSIVRITVEANTLQKPDQLVHLTVQQLPLGKSK
jgi:hypothetical protein